MFPTAVNEHEIDIQLRGRALKIGETVRLIRQTSRPVKYEIAQSEITPLGINIFSPTLCLSLSLSRLTRETREDSSGLQFPRVEYEKTASRFQKLEIKKIENIEFYNNLL